MMPEVETIQVTQVEASVGDSYGRSAVTRAVNHFRLSRSGRS